MQHRDTTFPLASAGFEFLLDDDGGVGASLTALPQDVLVVGEEHVSFALPAGDAEAQTLLLNDQQQGLRPYDYQGRAVAHDEIAHSVVMQPLRLPNIDPLSFAVAQPVVPFDASGFPDLSTTSFHAPNLPDFFHTDFSFTPSITPQPFVDADGAYNFVTGTMLSSLLNYSTSNMMANCRFHEISNDAAAAAVPVMASTLPTTSPGAVVPLQKKRKRKLDDQGRETVNKMRKLGVCFRCRRYKLKCNEALPCANCVRVKDSQKVFPSPCCRPNMLEVQTFRGGDGDSGVIRATIPSYNWLQGGQSHEIRLQWPFRPAVGTSPTLVISCQEFQPVLENLEEEYAVDGHVYRVKLPPLACHDIVTARSRVETFVNECQGLLEQEIRQTLTDPIMTLTWNEIKRYCAARDAPLVQGALRIYAGAMMNSKYPTSPDRHVFGVAEETRTPYFFEGLPLPPQLTYQFQTMVGYEQTAAQAVVLRGLKKRIFNQKCKGSDRLANWYEEFLTMFLLLASIELVYQVQIRFLTAKQGVSARNLTNVSFVTQRMLEEWEASAMNLVSHFRYAMNGPVPFTQSWDDGADMARSAAGLDKEAVEYIRHIKLEVGKRSEELHALRSLTGRERFGKPLAAICELFLPVEGA